MFGGIRELCRYTLTNACVSVWLGYCLAACLCSANATEARAMQPPRVTPDSVRGPAAVGQQALVAPIQPADADGKDEPTEALPAVVLEVGGTVEWAKSGVSPLAAEGWIPVQWKDQLDPGTQIRTGLRSFVHLQFGKTTVLAIRSATHASLDQIYRSATTEHVRLGLGYGTVRGGSVEGRIRADVVVDSTVATLAKRGTEGWEMQVEPMTGRYRISLAEYGLVEALQRLRGPARTSRSVRPGEYVTDVNMANLWIKQDIFDRNIRFYEAEAVTLAEAEFDLDQTRGYAVVAPGGGSTVADASQRVSSEFWVQQVAQNFPGGALPPTTVLLPARRPEGNFGTGPTFRVMVPQAGR